MFDFFSYALSARQRKFVIWSLSLLTAYTVIGFLILPPIIRSVAASQLAKQLDRDVSIQKVKLNPFALSITVDGLLIKDKDGQPFVSWDRILCELSALVIFWSRLGLQGDQINQTVHPRADEPGWDL